MGPPPGRRPAARIARQLHHAHLFSLAAWGAGLVYNDELSRLLEQDGGQPLDVDYADELAMWSADMAAQREAFARWDRAEFWHVVRTAAPRVPSAVRGFVDWWLDLAVASVDVTASADVREQLRRPGGTAQGTTGQARQPAGTGALAGRSG